MKLEDKDQRDLLLFELLEGELSATEAEELLQEINADEELQEEWALLQATQLDAPEMVMPNKSALIRKAPIVGMFGMSWNTNLSIAAAIAALLLIAYPISMMFKDDVQQQGLVSDIPQQEEIIAQTDEAESAENAEAESLPVIEEQSTNDLENPVQFVKSAPRIHPNEEEFTKPAAPEVIEREDLILASKTQFVSFSQDPLTLPVVQAAQMGYVDRSIEMPKEVQARNLREGINFAMNIATAPFNNSKVSLHRIQAENERSAFALAYTSDEYKAMATFQLKEPKFLTQSNE